MFKFKNNHFKEDYPLDKYIPLIKASICTGEQVIGFKEKSTNKFIEIEFRKIKHKENDYFQKDFINKGPYESEKKKPEEKNNKS